MAYVIFKYVAGVMERIVEQNLLYDFYGELLNDHQKKIYEDAIYNDLSLSEIADEYGISRQGVHDLIKRVTKTLDGYEAKLHLIQKFLETKDKVSKIDSLVYQRNCRIFLKIFVVRAVYQKLMLRLLLRKLSLPCLKLMLTLRLLSSLSSL